MNTQTRNNNQIIRIILLLFLLAAIYLLSYDTLFNGKNTVCIHNFIFGFQCPLCGMTRAVYQLMHLQLASAINYNFAVVLLPFYMGLDIATIFFQKNWLRVAKKTLLAGIVAALVLLYAYRIYQHLHGI